MKHMADGEPYGQKLALVAARRLATAWNRKFAGQNGVETSLPSRINVRYGILTPLLHMNKQGGAGNAREGTDQPCLTGARVPHSERGKWTRVLFSSGPLRSFSPS